MPRLSVQTGSWGWGGGGALREAFQEAVSFSLVLISEWALASKRRGLSAFQEEGTLCAELERREKAQYIQGALSREVQLELRPLCDIQRIWG